MGNIPAKLEQDRCMDVSSRKNYNQKQYRSISHSSLASSGPGHDDSTRSHKTTSLVGNLLGSNGISRADVYGGSIYNKKASNQVNLCTEAHTKHLVVMHDKCVDGGYLAPYGCYKVGKLDYDADVVQNLIVTRKLAPFYTPLQDYDPGWKREDLINTVNGLSLHAACQEEDLDEANDITLDEDFEKLIDRTLSRREQRKQRSKIFKAWIYRKSVEFQEEENQKFQKLKANAEESGILDQSLPSDDLKYDMYSNVSECPICFLFFPNPMNISRCCQQRICTECFVQIKRKPPHFPHDDSEDAQVAERKDPNMLISVPASCPYCATPSFGVTYTPPLERTVGIMGISPSAYTSSKSTENSSPHLHTHSIDQEMPFVVTSDMIRPYWEAELIKERIKLTRKAANATAIHVSNHLVEPGHHASYSCSHTTGTPTHTSNNSIIDELEEEMVRHVMRLSLLKDEREPCDSLADVSSERQ